MYKNCLNENPPPSNSNTTSTNSTTRTSINNGLLTKDPSLLNIDLALLEATSSNRSLTSSTTFASNQLIAAANAARSLQQKQKQQQHQSLSVRTTADSDCNIRGCLSTGATSKANTPFSILPTSAPIAPYPSLLQEAAGSNSIVQLLKEAAKHHNCKANDKDQSHNVTNNTDSHFLTPKSFDIGASQVSFSSYEIQETSRLLFIFHIQ